MGGYLIIICLFISTLLSGCATQMPPSSLKQSLPSRVLTKASLNWNIDGAVSIHSQGKTDMGKFTWEQIDNRYAINIYGPLNLGCIGIAGTPYRVVLNKPTGSFEAATPEGLMRQQLGWYLPISNMYYWIRGIPAPTAIQKKVYDSEGQLTYLQQQGFRIQFQSYQQQGQFHLPCKIILDNGVLHIKVIITHWNIS